MAEKDILVEIPTEELPLLLEFYQQPKYLEQCRYLSNVLKLAMPWKASPQYTDTIKFYSPDNSWRKDGTIVIFFLFGSYDVLLFTLEPSCDILYKILMETNRMDFTKNILLLSVLDAYYAKVLIALRDRRILNVMPDVPAIMYHIDAEVAKHWTIDCPEEVYIDKLTSASVDRINSIWPQRYPGSEQLVNAIINLNGGYGVFLKSNNELISWLLVQRYGLAILQTDEKYKRKGYGKLIIKHVCRELALQGFHPIANVRSVNEPSMQLFESLGFKQINSSVFISINLKR